MARTVGLGHDGIPLQQHAEIIICVVGHRRDSLDLQPRSEIPGVVAQMPFAERRAIKVGAGIVDEL